MRADYKAWLEAEKYDSGSIATQLSRTTRVETYYGDLDQHYRHDRLQSVVEALRYSADDERRNRPNPSKIPFEGNPRTNLASYRNAIEGYRRFLAEQETTGDAPTPSASPTAQAIAGEIEDLAQRIGLERDLQATLRLQIEQLETGLRIIDEGSERYVESGRIDITAQDARGAVVVIELKAGVAGQRAVAQILSYMGDVAVEEQGAPVRGLLVASDFDRKAVAAASMVPALALKRYAVRFQFSEIGAATP